MINFTFCVAGIRIAVSSLFSSTKEYFRDYLTTSTADTQILISQADCVLEQQLLNAEADADGIRRRVFSEPFLERSAIMRKTAQILLESGIVFLHGSTVAVDRKAYLFTAACGVGKSTHTRLWREMLGQRAVMVNDDRVFLIKEKDEVLACGNPWMGKHGIGSNITVPLAGICILHRGEENTIVPILLELSYPELEKQVFVPYEKDGELARALARRLLATVPVFTMRCTKHANAAAVAYQTMTKE